MAKGKVNQHEQYVLAPSFAFLDLGKSAINRDMHYTVFDSLGQGVMTVQVQEYKMKLPRRATP
jgi:hypothetical protein